MKGCRWQSREDLVESFDNWGYGEDKITSVPLFWFQEMVPLLSVVRLLELWWPSDVTAAQLLLMSQYLLQSPSYVIHQSHCHTFTHSQSHSHIVKHSNTVTLSHIHTVTLSRGHTFTQWYPNTVTLIGRHAVTQIHSLSRGHTFTLFQRFKILVFNLVFETSNRCSLLE